MRQVYGFTPGCPDLSQNRVAGEAYPSRAHPVGRSRRPGSRSKSSPKAGAVQYRGFEHRLHITGHTTSLFTMAPSVAHRRRRASLWAV